LNSPTQPGGQFPCAPPSAASSPPASSEAPPRAHAAGLRRGSAGGVAHGSRGLHAQGSGSVRARFAAVGTPAPEPPVCARPPRGGRLRSSRKLKRNLHDARAGRRGFVVSHAGTRHISRVEQHAGGATHWLSNNPAPTRRSLRPVRVRGRAGPSGPPS
jgi:hypothetical protein